MAWRLSCTAIKWPHTCIAIHPECGLKYVCMAWLPQALSPHRALSHAKRVVPGYSPSGVLAVFSKNRFRPSLRGKGKYSVGTLNERLQSSRSRCWRLVQIPE